MTPKAVVDALEQSVGLTGSPRQVRDAVESVFLASGYDPATAAEQIDKVVKNVTLEITRRQNQKADAGEIAVLHLRASDKTIVCGSSFVFGDDPDQIKEAKLNRIVVDEIYQQMLALNFNQFEKFSRSILRELGAVSAKVTAHAGDQGIDFYGELSLGGLLNLDPSILRLMHETKFALVGQAKHYPNRTIGPSIVRELVGALSLSRTSTFSKADLDLFGEMNLRPFSPALAILFTTGDFTSGARYLAKQAGLIAFSGWQLAVFLADRGIGITRTEDGTSFDQTSFLDWVEV